MSSRQHSEQALSEHPGNSNIPSSTMRLLGLGMVHEGVLGSTVEVQDVDTCSSYQQPHTYEAQASNYLRHP